MPCSLSNFCHIRPHHEIEQEKILDWIAQVHARAASRFENKEVDGFQQEIRNKLSNLGVGKERIANRGLHIGDLFEEDWEKMEIYPVDLDPHGHGFAQRSRFYDKHVSGIFEQFYPDAKSLPKHLIHVTCTGYVAPSPAQKLVSLRNAGQETTVTHAYHMGCYGSIPAIRIASGYASFPSPVVDIVHTELCSLHMHPLKHNTEQLIVQSLFADGFIKYSLYPEEQASPHLKILALHEETIPNSAHCMTWQCEDKGLSMTLSREVPVRISRALQGYLTRLCERSGVNLQNALKRGFFAIHPGGPKILQQIQDLLQLAPFQIQHSADVLKRYGNMSSATLPHIWQNMLEDPNVPNQGLIISLAFGPGLSISGGLFEKGV